MRWDLSTIFPEEKTVVLLDLVELFIISIGSTTYP
jgi:hypothetical protein